MLAGLRSHLKAWLGLEDPFRGDSRGYWQGDAGQWREASVHHHTDLPIGLLECPQNMGADSP